MTDSVQQHTTFETFLTQNEAFTDSFVESALGNDIQLSFKELTINQSKAPSFDIDLSRNEIKSYRKLVSQFKNKLTESKLDGSDELVTILDDVTELCSKTLYLLKLK